MPATKVVGASTGVGPLLRLWRERRRLSQLELALATDVSARHISFVETGRSKPSESMILRLAAELHVPMRECNALLLAAGYAPAYPETPLDAPTMAPLRGVLDQLLSGYEPYPAIVFDSAYDIVATNRAIVTMLDGVADELLQPPMNVIRLALHPNGLAQRIVNYAQVRRHLIDRVRQHLRIWHSDRLRSLLDEMLAYPSDHDDGADSSGETPFALPLRLRGPAGELSFISTVATFNTPLDITVAELGIETFLPADPQTAKLLHGS